MHPLGDLRPGSLATHHLSHVTVPKHNRTRAPVSASSNHRFGAIEFYRRNESCSSRPGMACQILHLCPPALTGRLATRQRASRVAGFWPFGEYISRPDHRGCGDRIGEAISLDEPFRIFSSDMFEFFVNHSWCRKNAVRKGADCDFAIKMWDSSLPAAGGICGLCVSALLELHACVDFGMGMVKLSTIPDQPYRAAFARVFHSDCNDPIVHLSLRIHFSDLWGVVH